MAVEAFADSLELVPRVLAGNAGLDSIDTLVDLRAAHDDGQITAGLNVFSGDVEDTFEAGVVGRRQGAGRHFPPPKRPTSCSKSTTSSPPAICRPTRATTRPAAPVDAPAAWAAWAVAWAA